jgi:hypothetical protein
VAWTGSTSGVLFNSIKLSSAVPLQNASDVVLVSPMPSQTWMFRDARIVNAGTDFAVGYGFAVTFGSPAMSASGPGMAIVSSSTGTVSSNSETGMLKESVAPIVGGIAFRSNGPVFGVAYRSAVGTGSTIISDAMFNGMPAMISGGTSSATGSSVDIAYADAADRFAIAYVDGNGGDAGKLLLEDSMRSGLASQTFTSAPDAPAAPAEGGVAIAGHANEFGVAWTDAQMNTTVCPDCTSGSEVFLARVAVGGSRTAEAHVGTASTSQKLFPAVVWDGQSYAVAWQESANAETDAVYIQRFEPTSLSPIGGPTPISSAAPAQVRLGLAVAAPGDYGVAYKDRATSKLVFVHVVCSSP